MNYANLLGLILVLLEKGPATVQSVLEALRSKGELTEEEWETKKATIAAMMAQPHWQPEPPGGGL